MVDRDGADGGRDGADGGAAPFLPARARDEMLYGLRRKKGQSFPTGFLSHLSGVALQLLARECDVFLLLTLNAESDVNDVVLCDVVDVRVVSV